MHCLNCGLFASSKGTSRSTSVAESVRREEHVERSFREEHAVHEQAVEHVREQFNQHGREHLREDGTEQARGRVSGRAIARATVVCL
jgi:hypothetical protein